ncbi:uncharacterized protein LOC115682394 isoform X3 [Syzygium oleosum]|uniref:uncharacterized protein LOC115682394 isoform X3 n=1 Tax=Syzygium oleosum TaxID=219896 RepID=UPI0024B8E89F|nr:uncharacterized protein LOC115682394 isoform X3 [Syzygium oleosum]
MLLSPRTFPVRCSSSAAAHFTFFCFVRSRMDAKPRTHSGDGDTLLTSASRAPPRQVRAADDAAAKGGPISPQEWRGWGCVSPVPAMVTEVIEDLKLLEEDMDAPMSFGGTGGKLQGEFKVEEDKKHRAKYQALGDSEMKLQFFAARQIACRLLGSRNYLCQKCWLPMEDCMCSKVLPCSLWHGLRFWVYMHPKDFLRQNNTGKLLWQLFGVEAATLCLFGIAEDEEIMWNTFKLAGKSKVWCLYPNKSALTESVQDTFSRAQFQSERASIAERNEDRILNFVLIDGTWSNSAAMFRRLKGVPSDKNQCVTRSTNDGREFKI